MTPKTKSVAASIVKWLTIASAGTAALAGGLALLPVDSASLVTPPSWRPYLAGAAMFGLGLSRIIVPVMDAVVKAIKSAENSSDTTPPAP